MEEKYLYFRDVTAIADDDDSAASACFPLSSLAGMIPTSDTVLTLAFKSMTNYDGFTHGANEIIESDLVTLTLNANNIHKEVMESLVEKFSSPQRDGMLIIADDFESDYCDSRISGVASITIAAVNS